MTGETPHPSMSSGWQPDAIAQQREDRIAYLDQVFAHPLLQDVAARALEHLALMPGQAVLEVGCGSGVFLPLLAREVGPSGRVVGFDYAPALVAEAQTRVEQAELTHVVTVQEGDAYHLPFPDASFDAAHCERVLMHLTDPTAALREMARVVRPGGWVVAAEPDWAGIRIDHPDQAGIDLLYRHSLSMTQPAMGLSTYRLLAEAGLTDRRIATATATFTNVAVLRAFGLNLAPAAEALVTEGQLTQERATALVTYLDEASRDGNFFSYLAAPIVAGRVPTAAAH